MVMNEATLQITSNWEQIREGLIKTQHVSTKEQIASSTSILAPSREWASYQGF